jgi:hypothetical protein
MSNNQTVAGNSGGVEFLGLLTIVFITLKLTGVINWSWWWVLSPILIPWAVFLFVFVIAVTFLYFTRRR